MTMITMATMSSMTMIMTTMMTMVKDGPRVGGETVGTDGRGEERNSDL